jgi:SAM-dependent methyltransferase
MLREVADKGSDGRWFMPAAERNKEPILQVLKRVLPASGLVLEIGSGTGQHVVHFARALPQILWQPSDPDAEFRDSITLWKAQENLPNVRPPIELDVRSLPWPVDHADAVVSINMIHVAPQDATVGLISGAASLLPSAGVLYLYGPFRRHGQHTAPSNAAFDAQLRARDPRWSLRDIEEVERLAQEAGFSAAEIVPMPSNNFSLVFRKS